MPNSRMLPCWCGNQNNENQHRWASLNKILVPLILTRYLMNLVPLTRALEGGLRITPSGGGAYNAPPSISAPMRANATNFGGYLGPYYNFFWPKFWDRGSTPSRSKRVEFQKCLPFWQKRTVFRFFRASSVTIIAMKNLKKTFESSWNALSIRCGQISTKLNSLGYTGHQSWKKNTIFKQNSFSWITLFLIKLQQ